ncbi:MAG TPA: potassium transporter [Desulfobacterales bacterium]|nr:potassium transporter [Desulfobacterales bacterium]
MDSCWILGAGRFGRRALSVLSRKYPEAAITVVDRDDDAVGEVPAGGRVSVVRADAMAYLVEHLKSGQFAPEWIVPAVPVHVAYEWVIRRLAAEGLRIEPLAVPETVVQRLPNVFRGEAGAIYASNADFLCPDNCPEPEAICTHTGKPRPCNLYEKLAEVAQPPFRAIVVRSLQLAPGVGGYRPQTLFDTLAAVRKTTGPVLLSTACRCHGVLHGFSSQAA